MQATLDLLREHGYAALFLAVLLEQLGLPLPAVPLLVGAGAMVGLGYLNIVPVLAATLLASLLADLVWYELGRRNGARILTTLCKISLEPDSCVQQTEGVFDRYGDGSLLFAKFVPGLGTVAPPVAGMVGLPLARFALLDSLGILIWGGLYSGLGVIFADQLESLVGRLQSLGATLLQLVGGGLLLYVLAKAASRYLFLRRLRTARITPQELQALIDGPEAPFIVDLRSQVHHRADPYIIPGALVLAAEELHLRHAELPRDRDIVLYCT